MGGYIPLFASLTTGTLCGKWPDVGLWPIVLSLSDKQGVVDVTPAYIAGITGLALEEVIACMKRFCDPDPYSRSSVESGARLALIDPEHRDWGWRIVNHGKYREKARKAAYDADRTESGRDAERKRAARAVSRDDPTRPDASRVLPLSDSDADTNTKKKDISHSLSASGAVERIFDHWKTVFEHPRAKLDDKLRRKIKEALKTYTEKDLIEAISGYLNSPFHMGKNDRNQIYDSLGTMLRDAEHIDRGIQHFATGKRTPEPIFR